MNAVVTASVLSILTLALVASVHRVWPRPRPMRIPERLDADWLMEQLIDDISKHPLHGMARCGGVSVNARKTEDVRRFSRWHQWTVEIRTPRASVCVTAPTTESMYTRVLSELRGIAGGAQ